MLEERKKEIKNRIKTFMRDYGKPTHADKVREEDPLSPFYYGIAITPEMVVKKLFRKMTIEEASEFLHNMEATDKSIGKTLLEDGTYVYYLNYKKKRKHW